MVINEEVSPEISCVLFSFWGAYILKKHYDLNALPKAGLAAYHIGGDNNASIAVGKAEPFHCWVEVDGWLIDFMAPFYSVLNKKQQNGQKILPKMMQKRLSDMATSLSDVKKTGDFYLEASNCVLSEKYEVIANTPVYGDLAGVCSHWYKKPPKNIKHKMIIEDQGGNLTNILLQGENIYGSW